MRSTPPPGLRNQAGLRTVFRVAGPLLMLVALVLIGLALDVGGGAQRRGRPVL